MLVPSLKFHTNSLSILSCPRQWPPPLSISRRLKLLYWRMVLSQVDVGVHFRMIPLRHMAKKMSFFLVSFLSTKALRRLQVWMEETSSYKDHTNHLHRIGPIKQGRMAADCIVKDLPQKRIAARAKNLSEGMARCPGEMWWRLKSIRKGMATKTCET